MDEYSTKTTVNKRKEMPPPKGLKPNVNTVSLVVQRSKSLTDQIPMGKLQLGKLQ